MIGTQGPLHLQCYQNLHLTGSWACDFPHSAAGSAIRAVWWGEQVWEEGWYAADHCCSVWLSPGPRALSSRSFLLSSPASLIALSPAYFCCHRILKVGKGLGDLCHHPKLSLSHPPRTSPESKEACQLKGSSKAIRIRACRAWSQIHILQGPPHTSSWDADTWMPLKFKDTNSVRAWRE